MSYLYFDADEDDVINALVIIVGDYAWRIYSLEPELWERDDD